MTSPKALGALPIFVLGALIAGSASAQPAPPAAQPPPTPPAQPLPVMPAQPLPVMPAQPPMQAPLPPAQPPLPPAQPPLQPPPPAEPRPWVQPAPAAQPGWGDSPAASPSYAPQPPKPTSDPGISAKGLPLSLRGGIRVDASAFHIAGDDTPWNTIDVTAHIPVLDHTFLDATFPLALGAVGNPTIGMRHVVRPSDHLWIQVGGFFGFPLLSFRNGDSFGLARGFWDNFAFVPETVPIGVRFGMEGHTGIVALRGQLDPIVGVPIARRRDPQFVIQSAVEIQIGHTIGGGLRYQQVIFATESNPMEDRDHYQGALEPFFVLERELIHLRLGLLLPLDRQLGAPFAGGWGVRASMGVHID